MSVVEFNVLSGGKGVTFSAEERERKEGSEFLRLFERERESHSKKEMVYISLWCEWNEIILIERKHTLLLSFSLPNQISAFHLNE